MIPVENLAVVTERKGDIKSITAGIAVEVSRKTQGGGSDNSLVVAGSVSLNEIDNDADAFIEGLHDDVDPNNPDANASSYAFTIDASDTSSILAIAGAISVGLGGNNLGVGLSLAINTITNDTVARLDDSQLVHPASASVTGSNQSSILAITIAGALAAGDGNQAAIAGTMSINNVKGTVDARLAMEATSAPWGMFLSPQRTWPLSRPYFRPWTA